VPDDESRDDQDIALLLETMAVVRIDGEVEGAGNAHPVGEPAAAPA
jgi:hypothetical protein